MNGFFREFKRINWTQTFFSSKKRTATTLLIAIPAVAGVSSLGYQYYLSKQPAVIYAHKIQTMQDQISKKVSLPTDEQPVIATVTDTNVLPKEQFFSFAKNGDKIFMYKIHKLAVLFRPSTGTVITQATLDFTDVPPTPTLAPADSAVAGASTSASTTQTVTVVPTAAPQTLAPTTPYHPQGKVLVQPQ